MGVSCHESAEVGGECSCKGRILPMKDRRVISDTSIGSESVRSVPESCEECRLAASNPLAVIALLPKYRLD